MTKSTDADLESALLQLYQRWADEGYRANRFYQMFSRHCKRYVGGVAAVKRLIQKDGSGGFTYLKERGLLNLTVEALVASRQFDDLFDDTDRAMARRKLQ